MTINYKITTFILAGLLIIACIVCYTSMYRRDMGNMKRVHNNMNPGINSGMHMMPDGTMMNNDGTPATHSMDSMMMDMVANMRGKSGTELEHVFISDMIPHHQGAVDMAKLLLADKTIKPELRTFAENIISAQESEIKQMNQWLKNYK